MTVVNIQFQRKIFHIMICIKSYSCPKLTAQQKIENASTEGSLQPLCVFLWAWDLDFLFFFFTHSCRCLCECLRFFFKLCLKLLCCLQDLQRNDSKYTLMRSMERKPAQMRSLDIKKSLCSRFQVIPSFTYSRTLIESSNIKISLLPSPPI